MKKGISLIVLVITIIVMIILAAAVVIAMSNNGIIDRASQAVQLTNEKQVQDLAALAWAEAYLDESRTDTMEKAVKDALAAQGVTDTNWNITVSDTGVVVTAKNNAVVEKVTFTFLGTEYTVDKGTTWYDFIWYGEGKKLQYDAVMTPDQTTDNVYTPAGFPMVKEDTGSRFYLNEVIEAGNYIPDESYADKFQ